MGGHSSETEDYSLRVLRTFAENQMASSELNLPPLDEPALERETRRIGEEIFRRSRERESGALASVRNKIERGQLPRLIQTVRGKGYTCTAGAPAKRNVG